MSDPTPEEILETMANVLDRGRSSSGYRGMAHSQLVDVFRIAAARQRRRGEPDELVTAVTQLAVLLAAAVGTGRVQEAIARVADAGVRPGP